MTRSQQSQLPGRTGVVGEIGAALVIVGVAAWVFMSRAQGVVAVASIEFGTNADQVAGRVDDVWWGAACWAMLAVALALICHAGSRALVSERRRTLTTSALIGAVAASGLAVLSAGILTGYPRGWWPHEARIVELGQAAAFARNCLLAIVVPIAICVLGVLAGRLRPLRRRPPTFKDQVIPRRRDGLRPDPSEDPAVAAATTGATRTAADERMAAKVHEGLWLPEERTLGGDGICVSGGGIRSACVALGALQALQQENELQKADYLVSVSGGGYTAGAYQLARTERPGPLPDGTEPATVTSDDVFRPGMPEEDHVRRHSSYVADTRAEWATALGTLLRGVLANLALLAATVVALGGLLYLFYRVTPIINVAELAPRTTDGQAPPPLPAVSPGVLAALVVALALTVLTYGTGVAGFWKHRTVARHLTGAAKTITTLTLVLAGFGLLPLVFWASARLTWSLGLGGHHFAPAGIGTALLTYAGALIGILWRSRGQISKEIGSVRTRLGGGKGAMKGIAGGLTQRIVVGLTVLMLAAVFLLLLGWTATTAARWGAIFWWALAVGLLLVAVLLDQTWLGLHPFYRRRLASAFSVRRVQKQRGVLRALRYDYDDETTTLSTYGRRPGTGDFPQVIFAGAANLSGSGLTPPGRRAVSYTMSSDWIGGPQIGWVRTAAVDHGRGQLSRDITVQAAVAISGAAFASAMGSQSRAYQTFFALTNARLGAWLPNPGYLADHLDAAKPAWTAPQPPRKRRLQYLLREIVGSYPDDNPLLFVTDGGHYENLGLVELLRHRCGFIYCIDASGDAPPLAATLAHAMTLAYEELGVTITLDAPYALVAGGGEPLLPKDPLSGLSGRLSASSVLTGTIAYPAVEGLPASTGKLVVAKASLTPDMPYEVLAYAQSNPVFPHDSTADQWFDVGQFDAYQAMGRHIGHAAAAERRRLVEEAAEANAHKSRRPAPQPLAVAGVLARLAARVSALRTTPRTTKEDGRGL
jgi:hypothetical protein